jgi:hypothetical protein
MQQQGHDAPRHEHTCGPVTHGGGDQSVAGIREARRGLLARPFMAADLTRRSAVRGRRLGSYECWNTSHAPWRWSSGTRRYFTVQRKVRWNVAPGDLEWMGADRWSDPPRRGVAQDVLRDRSAAAFLVGSRADHIAGVACGHQLRRDRSAVTRDVQALERFGVVQVREKPLPGTQQTEGGHAADGRDSTYRDSIGGRTCGGTNLRPGDCGRR